jgi:hypothetical protein
MKTTQDHHVLLNQIAAILEYDLLSITQYTDKSFQIDAYKPDDNKTIYNSDEANDNLDINDFCYYSAEDWVAMITSFNELGQPEVAPKQEIVIKQGDKYEHL